VPRLRRRPTCKGGMWGSRKEEEFADRHRLKPVLAGRWGDAGTVLVDGWGFMDMGSLEAKGGGRIDLGGVACRKIGGERSYQG